MKYSKNLNTRVHTVGFKCRACRAPAVILCYYPEVLRSLCDDCRRAEDLAEEKKQIKKEAKKKRALWAIVDTVNYKFYPKNGGNVSKARVEMVKRRRLVPDGNGEVVMTNGFGKITDRPAYNY